MEKVFNNDNPHDYLWWITRWSLFLWPLAEGKRPLPHSRETLTLPCTLTVSFQGRNRVNASPVCEVVRTNTKKEKETYILIYIYIDIHMYICTHTHLLNNNNSMLTDSPQLSEVLFSMLDSKIQLLKTSREGLLWDFMREISLKANRKLDLKTSKRKEIGISALRIVKRGK